MKTYIEQAAEIKSMCKEIAKRSKRFARDSRNDSPHYGDLLAVQQDLKETLQF